MIIRLKSNYIELISELTPEIKAICNEFELQIKKVTTVNNLYVCYEITGDKEMLYYFMFAMSEYSKGGVKCIQMLRFVILDSGARKSYH